ncbi:aldehyde dehydrogenase family protein [Nakamurella sp. UYEF19]|uniref:aldehyde dehydrogenase family protein n=1 Tax=Nakamurella sp. UYEF19 TaxID=1756392 RepID=UPI0033992098
MPIGEGWRPAPRQAPVLFPWDGSVVASAPVGDVELARAAIDAAYEARRSVAALSTGTRMAVLQQVAEMLHENAGPLVELLISETGKPRTDCEVEVARTTLTWELAAHEPARLQGETVPVDFLPGAESLIASYTRRPAGVVVGIAGFNYPLLLASHKIAPAIAAGCPVIIKPAPATPLSTLCLVAAVRVALAAAGAPSVAVQAVTGGAEVGTELTIDPRVAIVSFTGSAAVGHAIARACAPRRALLELGSNSALIVCGDADLAVAARAVASGGFYASGQACISVQRVIVVAGVYREFTELLLQEVARVQVGDPRLPTVRVAPLINEAATDRVLQWISDAVVAGAKKLAGGRRVGRCLSPAILADVPDGTGLWDEEVFGPVVALRVVADFDEAIEVANRSRYGLQASVFTTSLALAHRSIDELEVGGVIVNEVPGFRSDALAYGGVKDSGIGREGPRWAVAEYTVTRAAVIRPVAGR